MCGSHMQCPLARGVSPPSSYKRSASTQDRRRRPGSAPGPPAPALRLLVPVLRRASAGPLLLDPESSEPLPSIAPRATTWPALRRRVALRSSIAGVACRADQALIKRSSPDAEVKQQDTLVEIKAWMQQRMLPIFLFRLSNLRFNGIFEI